jgi:trimethylamine--corrinoid protein Co-methyltransferase
MILSRLSVLSSEEIDRIHEVSMRILETVGVKIDHGKARAILSDVGAEIVGNRVRIPEELVRKAVDQAPAGFTLYGFDPMFSIEVGSGQPQFAGLGTPTHILDTETGARRETTFQDFLRHLRLINGFDNIHSCQLDIWPNDIPMTTIHTEAIRAWAFNSDKPFGMGCYGYLPTLDMMRMTALAVGGKDALRRQPRFLAICSVGSPLQMITEQIEGLLICGEYGQPVAVSPEAIAGLSAPATLAGLLAQQNANILAHITLAQSFRPGTPVLYGTVSTIANMRLGTVTLGAVETGLLSNASAQLARQYGLPCRSVGGTTDAKSVDIQAGMERTANLLVSALAGADYITCGGTLDSTMLESELVLCLDDEICGALRRLMTGIEVSDQTLAADLIEKVGLSGSYIDQEHTAVFHRKEHYHPRVLVKEPFDLWNSEGQQDVLARCRQRAETILREHQPRDPDPELRKSLDEYCATVASRSIEEFYGYENEEKQDWDEL